MESNNTGKPSETGPQQEDGKPQTQDPKAPRRDFQIISQADMDINSNKSSIDAKQDGQSPENM